MFSKALIAAAFAALLGLAAPGEGQAAPVRPLAAWQGTPILRAQYGVHHIRYRHRHHHHHHLYHY